MQPVCYSGRMLSIGGVMFFKGLIVALWGVIVSVWETWKDKRAEKGIPLKLDERGVYVPDDWPERLERGFRLAGRIALWWIVGSGVLLSTYLYFTV